METTPPAPRAPDAPPVSAADRLVYRPISLLAIGSVVAAGLFTALIVITGVAALFQGTPLYLPPWCLGLAVLGGVLAAAAGWRIRGAEGTLAGQKLANWGWWLSIISGLGYAAFYGATALAVTQQSDQFLSVEGPESGFFPLLKKGRLNQAFLLTVPPTQRDSAKPDDPKEMADRFDLPLGKMPKGLLSLFRTNDIVRMLVEAGDQAQVKSLGVKEWIYDTKGFTVKRTYRVTTPEAELDVLLTTRSSEGGEGGPGRKWSVVFAPPPKETTLHLTDLGLTMNLYRDRGQAFAKSWVDKLNLNQYGPRAQAFLDTRAPAAREGLLRLWAGCTEARLIGQPLAELGLARGTGLPLGSFGPLLGRDDYDPWLYLTDYADFVAAKDLDRTDWEKLTRDEELRQRVRTQIRDSFFGRVNPERVPIAFKGFRSSEEGYTPARKANGKVQIVCDFDMPAGMTPTDPAPKILAEGVIVVEARAVGSPHEVSTLNFGDFRIVSLEVVRLLHMPQGPMKVDPNDPQLPLRGPVR